MVFIWATVLCEKKIDKLMNTKYWILLIEKKFLIVFEMHKGYYERHFVDTDRNLQYISSNFFWHLHGCGFW